VHSFDLVRWLTGHEVARVWCRVARVDTARTEDNFVALLELEGSDALVTVNASRSTASRSGLIDVAAAGGQLVGDHALGFAYGVRGLERTPLPLAEPVPTVREVLRAFVRLVLHGEPPPVTLEDGARAVAIAAAYLHSPDKETLFDAVVEETVHRLKATVDAARERARSPLEKVVAANRAFFRFARDNREVFKIVFGHAAAYNDLIRRAQALFIADI